MGWAYVCDCPVNKENMDKKNFIKAYFDVIFGNSFPLNQTDKRILEILADNERRLRGNEFGHSDSSLRMISANLRKLSSINFIKEIPIGKPGNGSYEYEILPNGRYYLEKPPLSRGERIIIILAVVGIVATIITGILTSHK